MEISVFGTQESDSDLDYLPVFTSAAPRRVTQQAKIYYALPSALQFSRIVCVFSTLCALSLLADW